jgi:heme/copper-type cytochrome/quinol oxidase subunit 2
MRPLTTRSSFVFGLAFTVLLLVPLWAGYGFLFQNGGEDDEGHGNMGGKAEMIRAFAQETQAFIAKHTRPDGCVAPDDGAEGGHEHGGEDDRSIDHVDAEDQGEEGHVIVYIRALQFAYLPQKLCLKTYRTYLFKMMATDVTHGASIYLGPASEMIRLPPGVLVEREMTFTAPDRYLMYCSFYCGIGHQLMKAQIIVESGPEEAAR